METGYIIDKPKVYGHLIHEATKSKITLYRPIGWFKRLMINWCFGLKYEKCKSKKKGNS